LPYSVTVKSYGTFSKLYQKNVKCLYKNRSHWKSISKLTIRRHGFVVYMLIYPLSKFGGQSDRFPLSFSSFKFPRRFKWKISANYVTQTGNFYFRQNVKPPFLCQYLMLFNDFIFTLKISLGSLLKPENRFLTKIADLKVYGNFEWIITFATPMLFLSCVNGYLCKPRTESQKIDRKPHCRVTKLKSKYYLFLIGLWTIRTGATLIG